MMKELTDDITDHNCTKCAAWLKLHLDEVVPVKREVSVCCADLNLSGEGFLFIF